MSELFVPENRFVLEGAVSIEAVLLHDSRPIERVYFDREKLKKRDRKALFLLHKLNEKAILVETCERAVIDAFVREHGGGNTHGGIVAICGEKRLLPLDELLETVADEGGTVVLLDGVEDPYNFGYAVRDLYAAGIGGLLLPHRNPMTSAGVCARASAGATEMCRMASLPSLSSSEEQVAFMRSLKKRGFYTVCAAKTGDCEELFSFEPSFPCALFIGGEKRGISPSFVENCDTIVAIPYFSDARYSLPTASTAAIFGFYLAARKRK